MVWILVFLLSFAGSFRPASLDVINDVDRQHRATHRIVYETLSVAAGCSATAVGPHTLLTAGHCLLATNTISIDEHRTNVVAMQFDDADHMLVEVGTAFQYWLPIQQRLARDGELVHIWGNPGESRDVYRDGTAIKVSKDDRGTSERFLMPVYPGDSGSGVMDKDGNVITVVSKYNMSAQMLAFPLQFTQAQLAAIK